MRTNVLAGAAVLGLRLCFGGAGAVPATAQPTSGNLTIGALTRTVTISGRRVQIQVTTWTDLMPPNDGSSPVAATVNLSTVHGRNLPDGLIVEKLLLRRTDSVGPGERRTWNPTPLPVPTYQYDPTTALYNASGGPDWDGGTPCEAVVRLRHYGRVIRVELGSLRVAEVY